MTTTRGDGKRDLVMAAAQDYDWEDLRPFVESLQATGFTGEIRFFASGLERGTLTELRRRGVEVTVPRRVRLKRGSHVLQPYTPKTTRVRWHVQPLYRHLVRAAAAFAPNRGAARLAMAGALANVEVARYFWYRRRLETALSEYRNVMLTDVRDVLFLGSPFDIDIGDDVLFFLEEERFSLGDQVNNRGWLIGAYGERALEAIADRPISCSGITIGAAPAVLAYLDLMVDHLSRLAHQFKGMDQGVHNYVVHNGLVPRGRLVPNRDGPVLTAGLMDPDEAVASVQRKGRLRIVHQYDRHARLREMLAELGRPGLLA